MVNTSRRSILLMGASALAWGISPAGAVSALPAATVYRDPFCGCCKGWIQHLTQAGFAVKDIETQSMSGIKAQLGVPQPLMSCHTAKIGPYTIEGHVPVHAILKLLRETPKIAGLAVPGMPVGSPGMEGGKPEQYEVIAFGSGPNEVFGRYVGHTAI